MAEPTPIIIPLVNTNEPGALLAALFVTSGQHVSPGDKLCTLETTKSTLELAAEADGYLVGLAYEVGQTIPAGEVLAYLADSPDWVPPIRPAAPVETDSYAFEDVRISQPALLLAQQHRLDLSRFSSETFITEKMVKEMISATPKAGQTLEGRKLNPSGIIIYGGGGHGKILIDLLRMSLLYPILGVVDDGLPVDASVMGVPVLGGSGILAELRARGVHLAANAVGGIGNIASRIKVFETLRQAGFTCPNLIHPTAFVEPSATFAEGVQVMPLAYVGSDARVGFGAIINTGCIVSHDCQIGDYVNLSPGAILAGEVTVGEAALIGMGVTVNLRVKIGGHARIGNGATVKQDVPEGGIVHAGAVWPA